MRGEPTKAELQQLIQQAQTKEMLEKMAEGFKLKLQNVIIATLSNFSPNVPLGLRAIISVLCSTAVRHGASKEQILADIAAEYDKSKELQDKAKAGTLGPDDPRPGTTSADGTPMPLPEEQH
jgi:hypothetical protein